MSAAMELPLVDLSSSDRAAAARLIRQACVDCGFFYLTNHGIDAETFQLVFNESKKFFSLPLHEKMRLQRNRDDKGYAPKYSETLNPSSISKGDLKETFHIGPVADVNQWPSEETLPSWRITLEAYYKKATAVGKRLLSLVALALDLDDQFFEKIGALHNPMAVLRLLHYPGELSADDGGNYGASAHSDYGMVTLLATDGVPGLQICREKDKEPRVWEDVPHIDGSFIVNVGDLLERWTNCFFRSTLHRVLAIGKERYSIAFFFDPNSDCIVQCLESCCSEVSPPRFLPIRSGDYIHEKIRIAYST